SRSSSPATARLSLTTRSEKDRTMLRIFRSAVVLLLTLFPGLLRAQGSGADESVKSTAVFGVPLGSMQASGAMLIGRGSLTAADGQKFPAPGTRLTLTCTTQPAPVIEMSDES